MYEISISLTKHEVRYLNFLIDNQIKDEPEYVTQSKAYKRFGKSNVDRWTRNSIVERYYRPKNVEYSLDELRQAAHNREDHLIR